MIRSYVRKTKSIRFEVTDPRSAETFWITVYLRGGKLVLQRLGPQLFLDGKTPGQLDQMVRFGLTAYEAFDEKMTGKLPPAAARVAALREPVTNRPDQTSQRATKKRPPRSNQPYYRSLIGEETISMAETLLRQLRVPSDQHSPPRPRTER